MNALRCKATQGLWDVAFAQCGDMVGLLVDPAGLVLDICAFVSCVLLQRSCFFCEGTLAAPAHACLIHRCSQGTDRRLDTLFLSWRGDLGFVSS